MVRICSETLARPAGFEPATPGLEGEPLSAHKCIFRGETRIRFNGIEKVSQAKGRHYILKGAKIIRVPISRPSACACRPRPLERRQIVDGATCARHAAMTAESGRSKTLSIGTK